MAVENKKDLEQKDPREVAEIAAREAREKLKAEILGKRVQFYKAVEDLKGFKTEWEKYPSREGSQIFDKALDSIARDLCRQGATQEEIEGKKKEIVSWIDAEVSPTDGIKEEAQALFLKQKKEEEAERKKDRDALKKVLEKPEIGIKKEEKIRIPDKLLKEDPTFETELKRVCDSLRVRQADLLRVMSKESGVDPRIRNTRSGATGLIQFMPSTARKLGTSVDALRRMTASEQMVYVEKYFEPYKGRLNSLDDLYTVVFYPAALGQPDNFVVGSERSMSWAKTVADAQGDAMKKSGPNGTILKRDFLNFVSGGTISMVSTKDGNTFTYGRVRRKEEKEVKDVTFDGGDEEDIFSSVDEEEMIKKIGEDVELLRDVRERTAFNRKQGFLTHIQKVLGVENMGEELAFSYVVKKTKTGEEILPSGEGTVKSKIPLLYSHKEINVPFHPVGVDGGLDWYASEKDFSRSSYQYETEWKGEKIQLLIPVGKDEVVVKGHELEKSVKKEGVANVLQEIREAINQGVTTKEKTAETEQEKKDKENKSLKEISGDLLDILQDNEKSFQDVFVKAKELFPDSKEGDFVFSKSEKEIISFEREGEDISSVTVNVFDSEGHQTDTFKKEKNRTTEENYFEEGEKKISKKTIQEFDDTGKQLTSETTEKFFSDGKTKKSQETSEFYTDKKWIGLKKKLKSETFKEWYQDGIVKTDNSEEYDDHGKRTQGHKLSRLEDGTRDREMSWDTEKGDWKEARLLANKIELEKFQVPRRTGELENYDIREVTVIDRSEFLKAGYSFPPEGQSIPLLNAGGNEVGSISLPENLLRISYKIVGKDEVDKYAVLYDNKLFIYDGLGKFEGAYWWHVNAETGEFSFQNSYDEKENRSRGEGIAFREELDVREGTIRGTSGGLEPGPTSDPLREEKEIKGGKIFINFPATELEQMESGATGTAITDLHIYKLKNSPEGTDLDENSSKIPEIQHDFKKEYVLLHGSAGPYDPALPEVENRSKEDKNLIELGRKNGDFAFGILSDGRVVQFFDENLGSGAGGPRAILNGDLNVNPKGIAIELSLPVDENLKPLREVMDPTPAQREAVKRLISYLQEKYSQKLTVTLSSQVVRDNEGNLLPEAHGDTQTWTREEKKELLESMGIERGDLLKQTRIPDFKSPKEKEEFLQAIDVKINLLTQERPKYPKFDALYAKSISSLTNLKSELSAETTPEAPTDLKVDIPSTVDAHLVFHWKTPEGGKVTKLQVWNEKLGKFGNWRLPEDANGTFTSRVPFQEDFDKWGVVSADGTIKFKVLGMDKDKKEFVVDGTSGKVDEDLLKKLRGETVSSAPEIPLEVPQNLDVIAKQL